MQFKLSALLLFHILTSCSARPQEEQKSKLVAIQESKSNSKEPYQIKLKLQEEQEQFFLTTEIEIAEGSYIMSHFASDMKGRFMINLEQNDFASMYGLLKEIPAAIEKENPFGPGKIKILQGNIICKQALEVKCKPEFQEIKGKINFVIEPRCTMEEYEFSLQRKSGKLRISAFNLIE